VLETVRKEEEKKPKRLGSVQPNSSSVWHTGLSGGAPDSVRCARLVSDESAALRNQRRRTTKNHRIVRWCTGLSGEPTVASANGRPRNLRATHGHTNGRLGTPDCPVCTGLCLVRQPIPGTNSQLLSVWKEIEHRT
jgi:adenylylsulfate kinase-like enzyme